MKKALLNVDYTVDFVADNGALTCGKPGQDIEGTIVQLTEDFISNGDYVVFAIDTHQRMISTTPNRSYFHLITLRERRAEICTEHSKRYTKITKLVSGSIG